MTDRAGHLAPTVHRRYGTKVPPVRGGRGGLPGRVRRRVTGVRDRDFDVLVRRHLPAVAAYARALTRDRWLAEEAVQETFLRAWRHLDSFDRRGSFEGWLIRICRNCVIDASSRPVHDRLPADELLPAAPAVGLGAELDDLLERLPLSQREVVALVAVLGYSYDEVAQLLALPIGTVRSRLHRARIALREAQAEDTPIGSGPGDWSTRSQGSPGRSGIDGRSMTG